MEKGRTVLLLAFLGCLAVTAWANFSLDNTISNDPLKDIMQRINGVVCLSFTLVSYLASSIAALVIIYAGIKYMTSGDADTASNARNMVIYAVAGLVLVLLACPLVDYLVIGTKIIPFEKTCDCWAGGSGGAPHVTTTTIVYLCTDGTPAGQCSATPAYLGYKCILGSSSYVLVLDSSCGPPSPSSTTTTSTSTTVSTASSTTTTTTLTDHGWCYNAETGNICSGLNVLRPGYQQDCCTEWTCCCQPVSGTCASP